MYVCMYVCMFIFCHSRPKPTTILLVSSKNCDQWKGERPGRNFQECAERGKEQNIDREEGENGS